MAYNLEEQEQIDALKGWWNDNGKLVMVVVIAALLTIAAFQGWRYYRAQQAGNAAVLFSQLEQAERANDSKKVRDIATEVIDRYRSTPYATMSALAAAKASFSTGELEDAKKKLQWAVENARSDELREIARLRLAAVLLDEKKYDDALNVVSGKSLDAYASLFADMRGDILTAQGKAAEARAAYQQALEKSDPAGSYRRLVEVKLDALGEAK